MEKALDAKTLGELDELMADLPAIDLYRLPDASLRRIPPHLGPVAAAEGPGRGSEPGQVPAGTVAMGAWAAVTSALIALWAVAAVVGAGTWFPWWALIVIPWIWVLIRRAQRRAGIAPGRLVSYIRAVRVGARGQVHSSPAHLLGFHVVGTRGLAYASTVPGPSRFSCPVLFSTG